MSDPHLHMLERRMAALAGDRRLPPPPAASAPPPPLAAPPEDVWLTLAEAAQRLRVSKRTFRSWMAGSMPYFKCGRTVRIRLADLQEFVAARQIVRQNGA